MMRKILVSGSFDDLRSPQVRFLQEAARFGDVQVQLWSDRAVQALSGRAPRFPQAERQYLLQALRYVQTVEVIDLTDPDSLPDVDPDEPQLWAVPEAEHNPAKRLFCASFGIGYQVIPNEALQGFPPPCPEALLSTGTQYGRPKVVVSGCYDWLHSGHVRFFEEVSELGDVYVSLGNDANLRALKGEGHPMFPQDERCYMVQSIRYVHQAVISPLLAWLDAGPLVDQVHPRYYAVNEDGDGPEKRRFCQERGIEYVVLKRRPKDGLPARQSTVLRGF